MTAPTFTMRQILEAGVHFGHKTRRWNPKMEPYLFGVRNNVHIIDLQQTVPLLHQAMEAVRAVAASGGRILFVGTKRQASAHVSEAAKRCGQYFVDHRWLGGMLTNWKTISNSIRRLKDLEAQLADDSEEGQAGLTKKELLRLTREREKLDRALGGIKDMGAPPDIIVVIDTNKEAIAVQEANKLGIPVVAVLDSNSDPAGINHPVPGNDDSLRAIELYCELISAAVLDGLQEEARSTGVDIGESEEAPTEDLGLEAAVAAEEAGTAKAEAPAEAAKPEAEKAEAAKPEAAKPEAAKPEAEKAEAEKAEAPAEAPAVEAAAAAETAPAAEGEKA